MGNIVQVSEVFLEMGLSASATEEERALVTTAIVRAEGAVRRHLRYDPVQRDRVEYYPQFDSSAQTRDYIWEAESNEAYIRRRAAEAIDELQVQHLPIRWVTTLYLDLDGRSGANPNGFTGDTLKTEGTDFWPNYDGLDDEGRRICHDGIIRSYGQWPMTPGSIRLRYTAGYSVEEFRGQRPIVDASPIWETVLEESVRRARKALLWKKSTVGHVAGPFSSESLGDYSYSVDSSLASKMFGMDSDLMGSSMEKLEDFINVGWSMASS